MIILSTVVAFALATIYCVVGLTFFRKGSVENQIAGAVMLGNPNNVLVIVFSSEFFGPVEPLVAAMYTIPLDDSNPPFAIITIGRHNLLNLPLNKDVSIQHQEVYECVTFPLVRQD